MSIKLKPYQKYISSPVFWLDDMPEHWGLQRMQMLFDEQTRKGFPDEPFLTSTRARGVIRKSDYEVRTVTAQKDFHMLKLVETGDFVISLSSFEGGIEISHARGIISSAYTVISPRKEVNHGYFRYLFKSDTFIQFLKLFVTGIRVGRPIDYSRLKKTMMPYIPFDEQTAIARFLNWANGRIDSAIIEKEKLLQLLAEQRRAVIHRAVTRGLDSSVSLKPSGVVWLGDIPSHWESKKAKWIFRCRKEINVNHAISNILSLTLRGVVNNNSDKPEGLVPRDYATYQIFRKDDLVFKLIDLENMSTSRVGLVHEDGIMSSAYVRLVQNAPMCVRFFYYQFYDFYNRGIYNYLGKGVRAALSSPDLLNMPVCVPTTIKEQKAIAMYLDNSAAKINAAMESTRRDISLLREYRARLISDAVTGKIDVRGLVSPAKQKTEKHDNRHQ